MAAWHRVPPDMFRFTTGDRSQLYSAILHAFGEANERLETALGVDDVRARVRAARPWRCDPRGTRRRHLPGRSRRPDMNVRT
ncbi:hypothetical protein GCM10012275_16150 [Longimycelium tulufanense]|uniref:Uncharacterized protein n=1 Tax=Longimycelium tulufanense TaxID=907463 RepID=A0A8J3CC55_9PSEU|nr:hypothetical protein GCM10012275_16150 [Longimycelium tulufanense]